MWRNSAARHKKYEIMCPKKRGWGAHCKRLILHSWWRNLITKTVITLFYLRAASGQCSPHAATPLNVHAHPFLKRIMPTTAFPYMYVYIRCRMPTQYMYNVQLCEWIQIQGRNELHARTAHEQMWEWINTRRGGAAGQCAHLDQHNNLNSICILLLPHQPASRRCHQVIIVHRHATTRCVSNHMGCILIGTGTHSKATTIWINNWLGFTSSD